MRSALAHVRFGPTADITYSITSSARASTEGGIVRPSALAVLRLIFRGVTMIKSMPSPKVLHGAARDAARFIADASKDGTKDS